MLKLLGLCKALLRSLGTFGDGISENLLISRPCPFNSLFRFAFLSEMYSLKKKGTIVIIGAS